MSEQLFTHAPIIENKVVKGLLDIEFLTKILLKDHEILLDKKPTLGDYKEFTSLQDHLERGSIKFLSLNNSYEELENAFEKSITNKNLLSMVLFTKNGKPDGELEGLCTIWDMFRKEQ